MNFSNIFTYTSSEFTTIGKLLFTTFRNCTMLKDVGDMKDGDTYDGIIVQGTLFGSKEVTMDTEESFYF